MKPRKTWDRINAGSRNVSFDDLIRLAEAFGFAVRRVRGSHHILGHPRCPAMLNLQRDGGQAKPYQVSQLVAVVERYVLTLDDEDR
ncbi:MAG: type II toxin-antitoxin system HicA family toxin [Burkholderiales bacterium]|nr:type II toxin-antitoxin system HicA family toxin [Burkholderiales bacterium]